MDTITPFARRLRELRDAARLTQAQLAEKAGMHRQGIAKLETGQREPAWATVRTLAKALGVNCLAFDVGEEPTTKETPRPRGRPRKDAEPAPKKTRKRKGQKQ